MAELDTLLRTLPRIVAACRPRGDGPTSRGSRRVSARQAEILAYLDEDDPTMVGELAEHVGVTASTMSLTLKRMEEGGLVRRERDPADRRVMNVRLTPGGREIRDATAMLDPERVHRMLLELGVEERHAVVRALVLLGDAADGMVRRRKAQVEAQVGGLTG